MSTIDNRLTRKRSRGRPFGAETVRTLNIARVLANNGVTPLEVMVDNMRYFHQEAAKRLADALKLQPRTKSDQKRLLELLRSVSSARFSAEECARDAAPYMHSKLATVDLSNKDDRPFIIQLLGSDADL